MLECTILGKRVQHPRTYVKRWCLNTVVLTKLLVCKVSRSISRVKKDIQYHTNSKDENSSTHDS
jgi:hypothetical protein